MAPPVPSGLLFPNRKGGARSDLGRHWAAICKNAALVDARLHDLRRTYASILVSAGGSLPLIGALLGHTQAQTTARYAHLMDSALRAATEAVALALSTPADRSKQNG